jgi:heme/copper-type cytochrome/quinol oxidase subunit 2
VLTKTKISHYSINSSKATGHYATNPCRNQHSSGPSGRGIVISELYLGPLSTAETVTATNSVSVNILTFGTTQNWALPGFRPQNFTVTEGEHVTIVLYNNGDVPHQLAIPQFNVTTGIVQAGQTVRVVFVPNKAGTFAYDEPTG